MSKIKTALNLLKQDPKKTFPALGRNGVFNWMPDKLYLQIMYYCETEEKLNLDKPVTFNEKLQWLKLYDRKPEYVTYVDKYAVREYIKQTIGEEYLIPLIGVYDRVEEIPWDELPDRFVLKCTHGSGCNIICTDKSKLNIGEAKTKLNKWMKYNYYWPTREWPYKNVKPRIICEEFIGNLGLPDDHKIMCFNGVPRIIQIHRKTLDGRHSIDFYGTDGKLLPITKEGFGTFEMPELDVRTLHNILEFASILSASKPYLRTDFYLVQKRIYFGELTFFDSSGLINFKPEESNAYLGSLMDLQDMENI